MPDDYTSALLGSLSSVKDAAVRVADKIDEKADGLAETIRNAVSGSSWLPSSVLSRNLPPSPPPPPQAVHLPALSLYSRLGLWVWENRLAACILGCTGLGLGHYIVQQRRASARARNKRRARRAANGSRREVVVLAGSPHDAIVKSLAQDLGRRGFVVFVVVNSMDDEQLVLGLGGADIRPLNIDLLDTAGAEASVARFEAFLNFPATATAAASATLSGIRPPPPPPPPPSAPRAPLHMHLAGMVLVPDSSYPTGPIEVVPADVWSDVLNLRLLSPFITAKLFVPLLRAHQSRLLVLTPAITPALVPAFHAPEAVAVAALDAFTASLRRELRPLHVAVIQLKLGTFDVSAVAVAGHHHPHSHHHQLQATNGARADLVSWPASIRSAYGRVYAAQEGRRPVRGSPLRELHHAVFDALAAGRPGSRLGAPPELLRTGSGSLVYALIGRFAPAAVVDWLLHGAQGDDLAVVRSAASDGSSASDGSVEWEKIDRAG